MVKLLRENEIDPVAEQVDRDMQEAGEGQTVPVHKFDPNASYGDLADGGTVNGVRVQPVGSSGRIDFKAPEPGRPNARAAWTWDGRPTVLPIAWDTAGKSHDGGRKYLMKRYCAVCNSAGFYGRVCPSCRKKNRPSRPGSILPAYYLKYEDVPGKTHPFGKVDCFVLNCPRRGEYGFLTHVAMRQHAMSKHRMEYRAHMDEENAMKTSEIEGLRAQIAAVVTAQLQSQRPSPAPGDVDEAQREANRERMAKVRAGIKKKEPIAN